MSDDKPSPLAQRAIQRLHDLIERREVDRDLSALKSVLCDNATLRAAVDEQRRTITALMDGITEATGKEGATAIIAHIAELERENAELRKKLEWQPIETAPKDGSPILLYSSDDGCHQGYWFEGSDDTGWCTDGLFSNGWTHWMPLPEPPK